VVESSWALITEQIRSKRIGKTDRAKEKSRDNKTKKIMTSQGKAKKQSIQE